MRIRLALASVAALATVTLPHTGAVTAGAGQTGVAQASVAKAAAPVPAATFRITSNYNNKCLDVASGNPYNGARVGMWDCFNGVNAQQWFWDSSGRLHSALDGNRCLTVAGGNTGNGAAYELYDCQDNWNAQKFFWYGSELRNLITNKCIDISELNWWNGAVVMLYDCGQGNHQTWRAT